MSVVDRLLNQITMYRLLLYYLILLVGLAFILALFHVLAFSAGTLFFSTIFILAVSLFTNELFARVFKVVTNVESVYLTALILVLIITPNLGSANLIFMFWVAVLAISSKFIFAYRSKHLFNPAAVAVTLTAPLINHSASWWVGTASLLPATLIGGYVIVRKIRRENLTISFLFAALLTTIVLGMLGGSNASLLIRRILLESPLIFFATVMLTEPTTTPPTKRWQIFYGLLVGILFSPQFHLGRLFLTPEQALLIGNILVYFVSSKARLILTLKEKRPLGKGIYDFVFVTNYKINFRPGQYLEWTLNVPKADNRGNRRYFTIASSPTENEVIIGVKFYPESSRYKEELLAMKPGDKIYASQLSGDFTLPKDNDNKYVFIAGGIGITPFRSMIKNLIDTGKKKDIVLIYSNNFIGEIVYSEIFKQAQNRLGLKAIYTLTDQDKAPKDWPGKVGFIDKKMIQKEIPDWDERIYYLSGPHSMVVSFEALLKKLGVPRRQIRTDYFPGLV